jgi:predicted RNA binding protein YcfA (HicA-like mRNA interferase family)
MKRREIERRLREMGYVMLTGVKRGGSHDKWVNKSGSCSVTVPSHNEVNELTARGIIKSAIKFKDE